MDFTWKNPTDEQLEALKRVSKALGVKTPDPKSMMLDVTFRYMLTNMNEYRDVPCLIAPSPFEMTEMMLTAKTSLWYSIASHDESIGAKWLVEAADNGFKVKELWGDETAVKVSIATTYCYVKILSNAVNLSVGSAWFRYVPVFLGLNIGNINPRGSAESISALIYNESLRVYDRKALKELRKAAAEKYEPKKCVHPQCDKLVAPRNIKPREGHVKPYGGTGACCREHAHYECSHPKCAKRAEREGWSRMTHTFDTKIGKEHLEYIKP